MRSYGILAPTFWTGETGRALRDAGPEAQLVALYLVTGPSANMIGIYHLPVAMISCHTRLNVEGASKALQRVCDTGFASYDEPSEMVFIPRMAAFQIEPELKVTDKRVLAVKKQLALVSKCVFAKQFHGMYATAYHLPPLSPSEGPSKDLIKPLRSQDQDQDQDSDQEHSDDCGEPAKPASPPAAAPKPAGAVAEPEACEFPVYPCIAGKASQARSWRLEDAYVAELTAAFVGVDVAQECRRAHAWIKANLTKRKTADGMRAFLFSWMTREQNSGRRASNLSNRSEPMQQRPVMTISSRPMATKAPNSSEVDQ